MATRTALVRQVQGLAFAAKADSNHWISMDGPEDFGGNSAGPRPKELVLMALGGCTASDVASILQKKRTPLRGMEVALTAHTAEEHPQVYTDIHAEYIFYGDELKPQDLERAIELSTTKYCSVTAMLRSSIKLTHSYRIEPAEKFHSVAG